MKKTISHVFDETIIRSYDIRGVYKKTLFLDDAKIIGNVFGLEMDEGSTVNVAYDGRKSSFDLKDNLIYGLLEAGINVNEIGLGPTPLLYFSCYELKADGGIMVTGSHNPKDHNGFKIVKNNSPFFGDDLKRIEKNARKFSINRVKGKLKKINISEDYIKRLFKGFKQKKKINIVWDAGNGAAGKIMKNISSKISGKQEVLFDTIDGDFPNHHPDPSDPENLNFCKKEILEKNLDVGFAFDGDGDRLGVVDDLGRVIPGDKILLLLAQDLLKKKKPLIIGDVKCSQVFFDEIERLGGDVIMSKTGHSHVKNDMKKYKADLAGEMSGHIFFAFNYFGFDDALYASIKFLEILNNNDQKLSKIVDKIPKVFNTPEIRIDCSDEIKFDVINNVIKNLDRYKKKIVDIDGIRVSENNGWWLLRASNTQPALVVRCESLSQKGLDFQKESIKKELLKTMPSLSSKIFS